MGVAKTLLAEYQFIRLQHATPPGWRRDHRRADEVAAWLKSVQYRGATSFAATGADGAERPAHVAAAISPRPIPRQMFRVRKVVSLRRFLSQVTKSEVLPSDDLPPILGRREPTAVWKRKHEGEPIQAIDALYANVNGSKMALQAADVRPSTRQSYGADSEQAAPWC
jgi:hypothetical protein